MNNNITVLSIVRKKLIDQLADPTDKAEVINALTKFIKSDQYDKALRIKAAWICADLEIHSIKEEILKMVSESSWRESPYRKSLDELIVFIEEKINDMSRKTETFSKKIEYRLTFEEYIEAQRIYIKTSPYTYYGYWVLGILGIIVGIAGIVIVPAMIAGYCAVLLGAFLVLSVTLFHRLRVARLWKKEPNISKPLFVDISEDDLHIISAHEEGIIKWEAFNRFMETKKIFMIFRQRSMFNVIPKRVFGDLNEVEKFRKLLFKKIQKIN